MVFIRARRWHLRLRYLCRRLSIITVFFPFFIDIVKVFLWVSWFHRVVVLWLISAVIFSLSRQLIYYFHICIFSHVFIVYWAYFLFVVLDLFHEVVFLYELTYRPFLMHWHHELLRFHFVSFCSRTILSNCSFIHNDTYSFRLRLFISVEPCFIVL